MKCWKTKKVPEQRTTDKDDQISKRVQWSHKKNSSHIKSRQECSNCVCFESSSKPFITRCHNHHHISLLNTRLLSWQEGRAIGLGSAFPQKNSTVVTQGTPQSYIVTYRYEHWRKTLFSLPFQDIKVWLLSTTTSPPGKKCMPIDKGRGVFCFGAFDTNYVTKRDKNMEKRTRFNWFRLWQQRSVVLVTILGHIWT